MTVYDLERLSKVPSRIVLSSCESGLSAVSPGDELMGFTAAVFTLGTQTVVAAVVPVPDETTKGLMLALDEELSRDTPPAQALVHRPRRDPERRPQACRGARRLRLLRRRLITLEPSEDRAVPPDGRAHPDRRRSAVLRADDPGVRRQALPDPVRLDVATFQPGQRILVNRFSHHVGSDPKLGDVTVFLPPRGALRTGACGHPGEGPTYDEGGPETRLSCSRGDGDALGDRVRQARRRATRRHGSGSSTAT